MVGAFTEVYRTHFALARATNSSQAAGAACDAVYQYMNYRLEHDRTWGAVKFTGSKEEGDDSAQITIETEKESHNFSGKIPALNATFKGTIINSLQATPVGKEGDDPVSPATAGSAYCQVSATCGESTRQVEFLLARAPLFDSSVQTRKNISVGSDVGKVLITSEDPNRNFMRAEGQISLPGLLNGTSKFVPKGGDESQHDERGMLWSKSKIVSLNGDGEETEISNDNENIGDANRESHGRVVPNGESKFPILEINSDNLLTPPHSKEVDLDESGHSGGKWVFVKRLAEVSYSAKYDFSDNARIFDRPDKETGGGGTGYAWVDVLEYYEDSGTAPYKLPGDVMPSKIYRAQNRTEDMIGMVSGSKKHDDYNYKLDKDSIRVEGLKLPSYGTDGTITNPSSLGTDGLIQLVPDGIKSYGDGKVRFDLKNQQVTVESDTLVKVQDGFCVESRIDNETDYTKIIPPKERKDTYGNTIIGPDGKPETYIPEPKGDKTTDPPVLNLGYEPDKSVKGGIMKATIVAERNIEIKDGVTEGLGSLISKNGDVTVQPKGTNLVDVDSKLDGVGLLVYAGHDITLTNPNNAQNWNFRGLVYAGNSVTMSGGGSAKNVLFEGSIVSIAGGISFEKMASDGTINFRYNSELLDSYVKSLGSGRAQLETIYWKR